MNGMFRLAAYTSAGPRFDLGVLDPPALLWPIVLGLACHALITAPWQPLGRPKPDLREQLRRLDVEEPLETRAAHAPGLAPPSGALEALLRPVLDDLSRALRAACSRLGLGTGREVEAGLALLHPDAPPGTLLEQLWRRKLVYGLVSPGLFVLVQVFGTKPLADWPFVAWPLLGVGAFLYPEYKLRRRVAERRARIVRELPGTIDLLAIGLAGGQSLEQTLLLIPVESRGVVGREFGAALREVAASRHTLSAALDELATRNGVGELTGLLTHLRASMEHGTANLVPFLTEQAATLRAERRLRLVAEAKRAQVRMLLPVGVGILPVLIVVLLAPAAMQLLGLGG